MFKKEAEAEIKAETIKEFAKKLCENRVAKDPVVIAVNVELKQMTEVLNEDTHRGNKTKRTGFYEKGA